MLRTNQSASPRATRTCRAATASAAQHAQHAPGELALLDGLRRGFAQRFALRVFAGLERARSGLVRRRLHAGQATDVARLAAKPQMRQMRCLLD